MGRFRLLKATDQVHFVVAEEEAQMYEVLRKTTYKDSPTVKLAIDKMLENKTVSHLPRSLVTSHTGMACIFEKHEGGGDLLENTATRIRTSIIKKRRNGSRKKGNEPPKPAPKKEEPKEEPKEEEPKEEEPKEEPKEEEPKEEPKEDDSSDDELMKPAPPKPKADSKDGSFPQALASDLAKLAIDAADYERDNRERLVDLEEYAGNVIDEAAMSEPNTNQSEELLNAAIELARQMNGRAAHGSVHMVGNGANHPIVQATNNLLHAHDMATDDTPAAEARVRQLENRVAVHFGGLDDNQRMLLYLSGLFLVESIYLNTNTVETRVDRSVPSFDIIDMLTRTFFTNHYSYFEESLRFWSWTRDMADMDARIAKVLNDANDTPEIQQAVSLTGGIELAGAFKEFFSNLNYSEKYQYVAGTMTPEKLKAIWEKVQNGEMGFFSEGDALDDFESYESFSSQYGITLSQGSLRREFDYLQDSGLFSNTHRYGPNGNIGMLMNQSMLYERGFHPLTDICNIVRVVNYYIKRDFSGWVSYLGSDAAHLYDIGVEINELETREFRRSLWLSVSIMALYSVPAFGFVSNILSIPSAIANNNWKKRDVVFKVVDFIIISRMFLVSFCHASLLSESMTDEDFHMSKSFGDAPLQWYYAAGAIELAVSSSLKRVLYGESNNSEAIQRGLLITTSLAISVALLDTGNPDGIFEMFFNELIYIPMTAFVFSSVMGLYKICKIVKYLITDY